MEKQFFMLTRLRDLCSELWMKLNVVVPCKLLLMKGMVLLLKVSLKALKILWREPTRQLARTGVIVRQHRPMLPMMLSERSQ